jgi:hypothetical protein
MLSREMRRLTLSLNAERRRGCCTRTAAWRGAAVLACALIAAGCLTARPPIEQRSTQGPTAREMLEERMLIQAGREPTFEEKRQWDVEIEEKIGAYLRAHPDKANALDVSTFRFLRQVTVGMDKEQVMILLGPPVTTTGDQAEIEKIARSYWPNIRGNATEVWVYPLGWNMFFAGQKLVDITQYLPPS